MEFVKKETVYHYKITQFEMLVLTGVLANLLEEGEIKVDDKETKEVLKTIFNALRSF